MYFIIYGFAFTFMYYIFGQIEKCYEYVECVNYSQLRNHFDTTISLKQKLYKLYSKLAKLMKVAFYTRIFTKTSQGVSV